MKEVFLNEENLNIKEIDERVTRVKALIINNNHEILLSCCENVYQFPGGHLEERETLKQALKREIKEETGITLNNIDDPFLHIAHLNSNYRSLGKNRQNDIYYYLIRTEEEPHLDKTNFDEYELLGNYTVSKVKLKDFKEVVYKNKLNKTDYLGLTKEMLTAYEEVLELI